MTGHYCELAILYRWRILSSTILAGLLALAFSVLLLEKNPIFEATVVMNMQPSEEALSFNREFLGVSQFNPATIIAQTHVERLLSAQIARVTLSRVAQSTVAVVDEPAPNTVSGFKLWLSKTWARLNYGGYRPVPQERSDVRDLLESLDVDIVEGSYILKLTVSNRDPELAARIANVHAQSYIDTASLEFQDRVTRSAALIRDLIEDKEIELSQLYASRDALRNQYDISNVRRESELLMLSLRDTELKLSESRLQLQIQSERLAEIDDRSDQSEARNQDAGRGLQDDLDRLKQEVAFRSQLFETQSARLSQLSVREAEFENLADELDAVQTDLDRLRQQLLSFELGEQVRAGQVQIFDRAEAPIYPSSPRVLVNTVIASIAGGVLVFLFAVMQDIFGSKIRTTNDLTAIVGDRALPHADSILAGNVRGFGLRRFGRARRIRRFTEVFGQRMSLEAGWSGGQILVTGYVDQADLNKARDFLGDIVQRSITSGVNERPFRITSVGPIYAVKDWNTLPEGIVVVVLKPGEQDDIDLTNMQSQRSGQTRQMLFMLWG